MTFWGHVFWLKDGYVNSIDRFESLTHEEFQGADCSSFFFLIYFSCGGAGLLVVVGIEIALVCTHSLCKPQTSLVYVKIYTLFESGWSSELLEFATCSYELMAGFVAFLIHIRNTLESQIKVTPFLLTLSKTYDSSSCVHFLCLLFVYMRKPFLSVLCLDCQWARSVEQVCWWDWEKHQGFICWCWARPEKSR